MLLFPFHFLDFVEERRKEGRKEERKEGFMWEDKVGFLFLFSFLILEKTPGESTIGSLGELFLFHNVFCGNPAKEGRLGKTREGGGKEGRKEGRKEERKEARKEGRKEGRKQAKEEKPGEKNKEIKLLWMK